MLALIGLVAGVGVYQLSSAGVGNAAALTVIAVALLACVLALCIVVWVLRPWATASQAMQLSLRHLSQTGDWSKRLPAAELGPLHAVAQQLNGIVHTQQQLLQQVTLGLQRLSRGDLSEPAHMHQGEPALGDAAQLNAAHSAALGHLRELVEQLSSSVHSVYEAGGDPVGALKAVDAQWQQHPLLGPVIDTMLVGNAKLLESVLAMTHVVEQNSITLAELSWQAKTISTEMTNLAAQGTQAASSSELLARNAQQVSADASEVAELAKQSQSNSLQGQQELQATIEGMRGMDERTADASASINRLQASSKKIEGVVQLIRDIADKVNLLSLNAAIEAARAGEHGKGFAVVASEVRNLAERTFVATQEIDSSVSGIMTETSQAVTSINGLVVDVQKNVGQIEHVGQRLNGILDFSGVLSQRVGGIVTAAQQSTEQVVKITRFIGDIQSELNRFGGSIQQQERKIMGLTELGEGFFDQLIQLNFETTHSRMFKVARGAADNVQALFEQAIANGVITKEALLSKDYTPIAHTNPPMFNSAFDAFCDQVLPAVQEAVLAEHKAIVFSICTNLDGYVPTHNNKFAKPPTGTYAVDLVNSRSKRIFNDPTGIRCGSHNKQMLLQTYKRDTGETMHDLSVPVYVGGQHWGGFRMGYRAD